MSADTCAVIGCEFKAAVRGWCRGHYQRVQRNGEPGPPEFRRRKTEPPPCSHGDCELPQHSRGWCAAHYQRRYTGIDMDGPIRHFKKKPPPPCAVEGCLELSDSRGWCQRHYLRWWRTGETGPAELPRYGQIEQCTAEGCERSHRTKGFCDMHYRRWKRGVPVDSLKFRQQPTAQEPDSYMGVHRRIVRERGRACDQTCGCGQPARQWAYQHNDPDAMTSPLGHFYSTRIHDCYQAMCQTCHNLLDRDPDEQERRMMEALASD